MSEKKYTPELLANAEEMARLLSEMPKEKQAVVTMMANSFIAGMEAQKALSSGTPAYLSL